MNEYETVVNENEHETRNRHVAMNEYDTVTNGNENEERDRRVAKRLRTGTSTRRETGT